VPRYRYKCAECDHQVTIFHLISEDAPACPACEQLDVLIKQLSTPYFKRNKQQTQKVGEITKEFIEKNKEVLEEEKTKRENYDPT